MNFTTVLDRAITLFDEGLRTLNPPLPRRCQRPLSDLPDMPALSAEENRHVAGLMRVNHSGEIAAQGLYQGQALTAQLPQVRAQMQQAAEEEIDHLRWCEMRLEELNSQPSRLVPLWYLGSLTLGALAGFLGDKISLGFVAETERQVSRHLQEHVAKLPEKDTRTQVILNRMYEDEMAHAEAAHKAGGIHLPVPVQGLMKYLARIMTKTSYYG